MNDPGPRTTASSSTSPGDQPRRLATSTSAPASRFACSPGSGSARSARRSPERAATDPTAGANWPGLVRAADLIGQLADPDYIRKLPALFHEFEETGANQRLGHKSHDDLREQYPSFYWNFVSAHVQPSIEYLKVTRMGRKWLASLRSTIFAAQHW